MMFLVGRCLTVSLQRRLLESEIFYNFFDIFTTYRYAITDTITDKLHLINASLFRLAPGKGLHKIGDYTGMLLD